MEPGEQDGGESARRIEARLQHLIGHLREELEKIPDPKAKALFETGAEVLGGLAKAFRDYEQKSESAWRA
jgi:hypothetical protein